MKLLNTTPNIVQYDTKIEKDLNKLPVHILQKFRFWVDLVTNNGIIETRKIAGFHDEPLHGDRKGQRSIRLNKAYRAIYTEEKQSIIITVIEVNKHDY